MKIVRHIAALALAALAISAQAQSVSGTNSSNSAATTASSSETQNIFTSPADSTSHYDYSGQYTVKQNASVVLGAFAPSMSGYNCSATGQVGGSQANAGLTAALGIPLLLDPGMLCVSFTAANQALQQAAALAPVDMPAAKRLMTAAQNETCLIGEVYPNQRVAMREAGIACPLGANEKKKIDNNVEKQYRSRDQSKAFVAYPDLNVEDQICGDSDANAAEAAAANPNSGHIFSCKALVARRVKWKEQELNTPSS